MSAIINGIKGFFQMLLRNKFKIALIPLIALAWVPFLFPYSDLRSVVATTLSRAMGDGTVIDFEHIDLGLGFPVALQLENFEFIGPGLPPINADRLTARPSFASIFTRSPAGSIEAEGLFKGNVSASLSRGQKIKDGGYFQDVKADIVGLQLTSLTEALRRIGMMSFNIQGAVDTNANLSVDPLFDQQPNGDVYLQAKSISIPSVSVPIPNMGPIQTPSLQLGRIELKGKMNDGKVQIEDFSFGQAKDALTGRVRGELELSLRKQDDGQRLQLVPGTLDLRVELSISKPLMDGMTRSGVGLALMMVEKYKSVANETTKYAFRVRITERGRPPVVEELPRSP